MPEKLKAEEVRGLIDHTRKEMGRMLNENSKKMLEMHRRFMAEERRLLEVYKCLFCDGSGVVIKTSFFGLVNREIECPMCLGVGSDWQAFERDKASGRCKPPNYLEDD